MFPISSSEEEIFKKLKTPQSIQDFINTIPINKEPGGDTCFSPREVLKCNRAHCIEGALLAAAILWYHNHEPLLLDLKSNRKDFDHVVAIFKQNGLWGAISKTNHAVLRFREPIYKNMHELAVSYFHEYFTDDGEKTLRSYSSRPFSLKQFGKEWITSSDPLWDLVIKLNDAPHTNIIPENTKRSLRHADPIEIKAGKITEYK